MSALNQRLVRIAHYRFRAKVKYSCFATAFFYCMTELGVGLIRRFSLSTESAVKASFLRMQESQLSTGFIGKKRHHIDEKPVLPVYLPIRFLFS